MIYCIWGLRCYKYHVVILIWLYTFLSLNIVYKVKASLEFLHKVFREFIRTRSIYLLDKKELLHTLRFNESWELICVISDRKRLNIFNKLFKYAC